MDGEDDYDKQVEAEIKMLKWRERKQKEQEMCDLEKVATKEWLQFCFWCNTTHAITIPYSNGKIDVGLMKERVYCNPTLFEEYMANEKPNGFNKVLPDLQIKKKIYEMFFGYIFEYDSETQCWRAYKRRKVANLGA